MDNTRYLTFPEVLELYLMRYDRAVENVRSILATPGEFQDYMLAQATDEVQEAVRRIVSLRQHIVKIAVQDKANGQ